MSKPAITGTAFPRMTSDEFIAWAMEQPEGHRYELVAGEIVAMAPERSAHALVKVLVWQALHQGLRAAGLPGTAYPDGMAVVVDDATTYEPDALVRCGESLPGDAVEVLDPVIVVEVLSPSTMIGRADHPFPPGTGADLAAPEGARDTGAKLEDYFRLPSLHHYLIVKTENRTVIHHRRLDDGAGTIATRIVRGGRIELSPPGLRVAIASFFP